MVMYDFQVWPRGVASAGRFWHYEPDMDKQGLAKRVDWQGQVMSHATLHTKHCTYRFMSDTPAHAVGYDFSRSEVLPHRV